MNETDAALAAEKADAIRIKVGYPLYPDTRSAFSMYRYYSTLKIKNDSFFSNALDAAFVSFSFYFELGILTVSTGHSMCIGRG